jgi:tetratricopeptide (TPR) repeat protein
MTTSPVIVLQLTRIPKDDDYLAQIMISPRGTSDQERFALADTHEVFRLDDDTAQTLAQLKGAIDSGSIGPGEMDRLGEFLYNLIFTGLVERKLSDVIIQEKERPYRLCILIHQSAPFLETVPWEYMKRPDGFVALSLASVTRVLEDRDGHPFDPIEGATMLLVYANPPGYGGSKRHAEIEAASTVFIDEFIQRLETRYNVKVTKLIREEATREKFLTMLSEQHFDIVHFIGHGEVLKGDGNIVMHDNQRIPGEEIYSNLSNKPPRLFYFNSCSTAKANNRDPFSSVAQALIRPSLNPVPAVIAMQYEIDVNDSFVVAEEFYERLLNPQSRAFGNLETAMDYARRKLRVKNSSWGIPVVFLQTRERVMLFGEPAAGRPPAQLKRHLGSSIPEAPKNLINRAEEVAIVRNLLSSDHRLMMVTGLPGVGRGAVVRAGLNEYLQDEREEIPIWLNLEGIKPEDATLETLYVSLDKILETGLKPMWYDQRRSLTEKLAELEAKIPNTAILVLENIDALLDEECHFRDEGMQQFFLHFGKTERRIFIIITSRFEPKPQGNDEEWRGLWQSIKVQRLKTEDAVELLRKEGLTHSDQELYSLAEAVNGHPQTLKIVAAGIAQGSVNLERFVSAPKAATGLTGYFAEAMMASLTDAEARALKVWSVFRNPVLREALIQIAGSGPDAERIVDSVSTKGLLNVKNEYYFLPTLVRSVANDELQRDPLLSDEAHHRAAAFFLMEAERAWDALELLPSYAVETERINNYLEARYHLRERVDENSKQRAQEIAVNLFQALADQGRFSELRILIEQSESEFDDFMVEFFRAQLEGLFGEYQNALDRLELLYFNVEQGSFKQGSVANEIGVVLKERSDPRDADEMLERFEEAYDIFANIIRSSEDQREMQQAHHSQAVCTYNRGLVYQYFRRGNTPEEFNDAYLNARKFYDGALQIYRTLEEPDEQGIAMVFSQLGELLADKRFADCDPEQAEKLLREALAIAERIGKPRLEIDGGYQLSRFLRRRGDSAEARALFRHVADVAERIELRAERAIAEVQIAEIDFKDRQYDRDMLDASLSRNEETLSYYEDLHSIRVQSDAYFLHGLLHLGRSNQDKAIECFESSRSVMTEVAARSQSRADARRIARGTVFLAQIVLQRQGSAAAQAVLSEMQEHFEKIGYELRDNESVADFIDRVNEWKG